MPDVDMENVDPTGISSYDGLGGRAATEEGHSMENVIIDNDESGDASTRPMCFTNGDVSVDPITVPDTQGPSDGCCRVYEAGDFKGRHYDFCVYDPNQCSKKWDLDITGWHNEINSIWCADNSLFRLCAHINDTSSTADNWGMNECKGGQDTVLESLGKHATLRTGVDEASDSLWVFNNTCDGPNPQISAVVYDERDCNGNSYFAHPDVWYRDGTNGPKSEYNAVDQASVDPKFPKWRGSYDYYQGDKEVTFTIDNVEFTAKNDQLDQGHDESVLLSNHLEFELFTTNTVGNTFDQDGLFERHETYTLRQFSTVLDKSVPLNDNVDPAVYTCHNYPVDMNKAKTNGGKGGEGITLYTDPGVD